MSSSLWASLRAASLSDVAKELVSSDDSEPQQPQIDPSSRDEVFGGPIAALPAGVVHESETIRLSRELEQSIATSKRLKAYLLEYQSDSEATILELQRQLEAQRLSLEDAAAMRVELDKYKQLLSASSERETACRAALRGVEAILSNVQADQEQEVHIRTLHLQKKLVEATDRIKLLEDELTKQQKLESDLLELRQQNVGLHSQLERAATASLSLSAELKSLRAFVAGLTGKADSTTTNDDLIDKRVVKKLVTSYFNTNTTATSRRDILELMSRILDLSEAEQAQIGLGQPSRGWFSGFSFSAPPPSNSALPQHADSLAALWIKFLENQTEQAASANPAPAKEHG